MNYKIVLSKKVQKFLLKHKWESVYFDFQKKIKILEIDTFNNNLDIKKLSWNEMFRLRIWKYRFIYEIIDDKLIINFVEADKRWDIY